MARTLQSSGLATKLSFVVCVDDDDTTIKEFVSSSVNTDMTFSGVTVGSGTWKSNTRPTMITSNSGTYSPNNIRFGTTKPAANFNSGCSVFVALKSFTSVTGQTSRAWACATSGQNYGLDGTPKQLIFISSSRGVSNTTIPTATAISFGMLYDQSADRQYFYGLESGSLAADSTAGSPGNYGSDASFDQLFGFNGFGTCTCEAFLIAGFTSELVESEFQDLHNNLFEALFEAGGGGLSVPVSYMNRTQQRMS